jgi:DNA-directed RNA polymerase specialized sigma24 family protein
MMLHGPLYVPGPALGRARRTCWQVTREAFEALLARLAFEGRPATAEYERLHRRLVLFFDGRGCVDADVCADKTLDRVARKLQQGMVIENIRRYAYAVARLVARESARTAARVRIALAQSPPAPPLDAADDPDLDRLKQQLAQLAPETRALLVEYYEAGGRSSQASRRHLAERMGISYVALKVRAHRARTQLARSIT